MAEIAQRLQCLDIDVSVMEQKKRAQAEASIEKERLRLGSGKAIMDSVSQRSDDPDFVKEDSKRPGGLKKSLNKTFSLADSNGRKSSELMLPSAVSVKENHEQADIEAHRDHHLKHAVPKLYHTLPAGALLEATSFRNDDTDSNEANCKKGKRSFKSWKSDDSVLKVKKDLAEQRTGDQAMENSRLTSGLPLMRTAGPTGRKSG